MKLSLQSQNFLKRVTAVMCSLKKEKLKRKLKEQTSKGIQKLRRGYECARLMNQNIKKANSVIACFLKTACSKLAKCTEIFSNGWKNGRAIPYCIQRLNIFSKMPLSDIRLRNIPSSVINHMYNVLTLIIPYTLASLLIYPKLSVTQFLQEIFSLLCIYCAIFLCFWNEIGNVSRFRAAASVTVAAAPIIFANNAFAVALVVICTIFFMEFVFSKYLLGCRLFSNKIPVLMVCENREDGKLIWKEFGNRYKILDIIFIPETSNDKSTETEKINQRFQRIKQKLNRVNRLCFYPFPRRIIYFSSKHRLKSDLSYYDDHLFQKNLKTSVVLGLLDISAHFSVPLFNMEYVEDPVRGNTFQIRPFRIEDFDHVQITSQERARITDSFKNRPVWIFYDGRRCILDLIRSLSSVTSLTIFCNSEYLMREMEIEFGAIYQNKERLAHVSASLTNVHKVKIADKNFLLNVDSKPEVILFSSPLLHLDSSEDNLKEAVVKNVTDVAEMVDIVLKLKAKFVFFLSTLKAFNTEDWIGATQRLGELHVQLTCNRQTSTKFRIIRLPGCLNDPFDSIDQILRVLRGERKMVTDGTTLFESQKRDAIFHPFLKLVLQTLRDPCILPDIYSVIPSISDKELAEITGITYKLFGIRREELEQVRGCQSMDTNLRKSAYLDISKLYESTNLDPSIKRTRYLTSLKYHEIPYWSADQVNNMSTRDIIAAVFQALNKDSVKTSIEKT